ncbi:MAG: site-specific integrase [Oscillospiraceae bacterium]|nr:site-specific integrase [Oscillospiraceae bacterium]MDE7289386.1 site-specific integrase [Oscillospiraceae bacterium]
MATIQKRNGSYSIRVSCGYDTKGKQIIQSMTWKPSEGMTLKQIEKELKRQSVLFEEACMKGFQSKAVKFETFCEEWFEEYAKTNLRNTTYERLLQLRGRIYPVIGHIRMDKITSRQIQAFVNSLSKEGANERTGKPLAPKTIRHNLSLISDVFSYAVKMGVVAENPCSKVTIPKGEVKEKQIYTPAEVERFLTLLNDEPLKYRTFFYLMIYSGFRRGEMLGLEWKDVDFENNIISVRRTSNYTAKKGVYTDTTKTKRSQRTLKFPQFIMDMLKEYKEQQDAEALRLGDRWVETDRLYVKWDGRPMQNGTPYFWLGEFCEKHDLPFYGLHSFRHLFCSLLVNQGVDIVTVSGALGHSCVSTTSNVYCHMFQEAQAKVSDAVANALDFSKSKEPKVS